VATTERHARDGRHHGLTTSFNPCQYSTQNRLLQLTRRAELGDICTGGKCLFVASQHDAVHVRVGLRLLELQHDALTQRMTQAVDRRIVECDDGNAVADIGHGRPHSAFINCLPMTSCWICVVPS
jgi:hypothetical protein